MKIVFDYQIFSLQAYGGISRYFIELAQGLSALEQEVKIFSPFYINNYLDGISASIANGRKLNRYLPKTARLFMGYNYHVSNMKMRNWKPDIVHETYYSRRNKKRNIATVLTVYDMIHELYPDSFSPKDLTTLFKKNACDRADHIVSISHSTKKDLVEIFNVDPSKVTVVHLGADFSNCLSADLPDNGIEKPFLLYVGNRGQYKNFGGLLRVFAASKKLKTEFNLIAFGGGIFTQEEKTFIAALGFSNDQIIQVSGDDSLLKSLYKSARAFVYPSLYEGFGLPPLEAMSQSCPVIASNTSSMPEVIGDAGVYFDPSDLESMQYAIENFVLDEERHSSMIAKGHLRLKNFSWERCAQETYDVYHHLAG